MQLMYRGGSDLFILVQNMYLHENKYSEPPREIDSVWKYLPEDIVLVHSEEVHFNSNNIMKQFQRI